MVPTIAQRATSSRTERPEVASPPPFLTVAQAAELAQVHPRTVRRWIVDGLLASSRPVAAGSGRRWIERDDLLAFLRGEVIGQ